MTNWAILCSERGLIPDTGIRAGIRRLLQRRLSQIGANDCSIAADIEADFIEWMDAGPVAEVPHKANEQHYEIPGEFFRHVMGRHMKYSACYWTPHTTKLDDAEANALRLTCERAGVADGQRILELGCGWGSLTLWMASNYPNSEITAVSNSLSQREFIMQEALNRGLFNLRVITADMNDFDPLQYGLSPGFDRVVSVEMFEHMRNHRELFGRIHNWLKPGGRFFMHIFVHRSTPYAFEVTGDDDWMGQFFFSGGIMPSDSLPLHFQEKLKLVRRWRMDGTHYEKTANAWLRNMDEHNDEVWHVLKQVYGAAEADIWRMRWRIFFMSCAELFGARDGQEWWVSHYLFERPQ